MRQFWLAFTHVRGIGPARLRHLCEYFGDIETAWNAGTERWLAAGLPGTVVNELERARQQIQPERLLEQVQRLRAWVITLDDEVYPPLLREIENAPIVLYGRGELTFEDQRALAVVGTRRATTYGKEVTSRLVTVLAQQNFTIVSGLAHGIDVTAHRAALDSNGRTVAVLGCGIDQIYPPAHRDIAGQIIEQGAIITEFPPKVKPERYNFPMRNRIISGMCLGTVIIEAPESSGALHTAELAGEQGREVFAVPGNITSGNSTGTNRLIQDGAKLVIDATDILEELNLAYNEHQTQQQVKRIAPSDPREREILRILDLEPLHVDELSRRCELSIQEVNAVITLMELKGLVLQVAPMTYQSL